MKHITINIRNNINLNEKETTRFLAAKMYESGKLSLGQTAELARLSKMALAEILSDYDVSKINYPPSEVAKDVVKF